MQLGFFLRAVTWALWIGVQDPWLWAAPFSLPRGRARSQDQRNDTTSRGCRDGDSSAGNGPTRPARLPLSLSLSLADACEHIPIESTGGTKGRSRKALRKTSANRRKCTYIGGAN